MSGSTYTEEVLDLRELILILWRRKWLILGAAVVTGILVFLISTFLVPARYQASAIVTITDRNTWAALETKSMIQLAESEEVIQQTYLDAGFNDLEVESLYSFTADVVVRSQLDLGVNAENPDLAAAAANVWAEVVSQKLNEIYGTSEASIRALEEQISSAKEVWDAAQTKLDEFLAGSNQAIYPAQIAAAQAALEETIEEIERNDLLISDIEMLEDQLELTSPSALLDSAIRISLINLQARSSAFQEIAPLQVFVDEQSLTQIEAFAFLQNLKTSLETQTLELVAKTSVLEDEILDMSYSLEADRNQDEKLRLEKNLALATYSALAADLEEAKILQEQEKTNIVISVHALPPQDPLRSDLESMIGFAAAAAALLAMLGSLAYAWWVGKDDTQTP